MIHYSVTISDEAEKDLLYLKKNDPKSYAKALTLIKELYTSPTMGTGQPKPLRHNKTGQWSRRITQKHRLIYQIIDEKVVVLVLSAYGHYDDR